MPVLQPSVRRRLEDEVQRRLESSPRCHDWDHTARVTAVARHLAAEEQAEKAALEARALAEEQARIRGELGEPAYDDGPYLLAGELLDRVVAAEELEEFLTLVAYDYLN